MSNELKCFILRENCVSFSRHLDFCAFHESTTFKIYDVIIDITEYKNMFFLVSFEYY